MRSEPSRLKEDLDALDREVPPGRYGLAMAHRRATLLDETLRHIYADAGSPAGIAVCAIGGYGRGRLLPRSDVDLLIVHGEGEEPGDVEVLTAELLYPLWDAGLEVGQAVRTPRGCAAIAAERLDALTAMLDLRHLAGEPVLAELTGPVIERKHGVPNRLLAAFAVLGYRETRHELALGRRAVLRGGTHAAGKPHPFLLTLLTGRRRISLGRGFGLR